PRRTPSLRHAPLLPSPPPSRAAPHGLRGTEALPSVRTTLRSLGRAPTCQARPPAGSPAARRLPQTPAHPANAAAAAAPTGTEASLQTPTPARFPGSTSPSPSSSPPSCRIHFRARQLDERGQPQSGIFKNAWRVTANSISSELWA
ncbi:uncharacterized protein, partial [Macaca nemestrina]|uniref:uncharacterized protein n=1 Tax=Macaca nemestrina TaxID=9545 RepID=UPI0039B89072